MPLLSERPVGEQVFIVLVLPALFGAICGVLLGISAGVYTVLTLLGILGGTAAGYDHPTASEGALRGVVRGFHAEVDLAALGRPLQAMIAVRLAVHAREEIDAFTRAVRALPGVLMVFHLTGVTDYLVWVAAEDAQDLREFVVDHLATHPSVAHAETSLIYEHTRGPGIWGAADAA